MNNRDLKIMTAIGITVTALSSVIMLFIEPICSIVCLITGLTLTGIYITVTKKRYKDITELNNYLSLVCSGKYDLDIGNNCEGELSILKNNLYKVITLLRSQNDELQKERINLADSLADISHQLKTPLTSMAMMTDLLRDEKDERKRQEFIKISENQLDKMKWLITNLLKLSKLDAKTVDFKHESVEIKSVIKESVKPFLVLLELKGITLNDTCKNFYFKGDKRWTCEAVENVIKNCIEHTDKGGKISLSSVSTSIYNSLIISDNGCGVAKDDLPHIFDRFYHGKNSSKDSVGIGLALAKTVMQNEKGTILIESEEGVGTRFELRFYNVIV